MNTDNTNNMNTADSIKIDAVNNVDEIEEINKVTEVDEIESLNSIDDLDTTEEIIDPVELADSTEPVDPIVHYVSCLKNLILYCAQLFFRMFTSPLSTLADTKEDKSRFPMLFWGVMHILVILGGTLIYVPILNEYISLDAKLVLGTFFALIVASTIFIHAIITYIFGKSTSKSTSFKNVLSYFSLATVPVTILVLLASIFDYIFIPIAVIIYFLAYFSWILLSLKATEVALNNKGFAFWVHILNSILAIIGSIAIIVLLGLHVCEYFLNDLIIHMFSVENIATFIGSLDLLSFLQ